MRKIIGPGALGLVLLMSACAAQKAEKAPVRDSFASLREPGCYTVDLFRDVPINPPPSGVTQQQAAFLGEWGNGVWNGEWCHDLLIHTLHADGRVELLDMHAPTDTYRQPASIFKRTGQVDKDGTLRFAHGVTVRRYRIIDGLMHGEREGSLGSLRIVMSRKGAVPLPTPRPVQIARATLAE